MPQLDFTATAETMTTSTNSSIFTAITQSFEDAYADIRECDALAGSNIYGRRFGATAATMTQYGLLPARSAGDRRRRHGCHFRLRRAP
jgi:hypothetical protein